uniref:kelch-like protein 3 n=1 Tax=Styela clava TaxID=7725 RepID=UPI001939550D|nr:kelch-like protein 3 [Styela clava]
MEDKIPVDGMAHSSELLKELNNLRKRGENCDFIIRAGDLELPAHKNVLKASSRYFRAMMAHDNIETQSGEVEIKDADPECVMKCIDFIYTGEAAITEEKRGELMHVAHMMELQRLCDAIVLFLEDSLNVKSFFVTRSLADIYSCKQLEKVCDQFALEHFRDIALLEQFYELDDEYIRFLIGSKKTQANEAVKCKTLLRWAEADIENRKESFREMFNKMGLMKIPASYRRYMLENENLVKNSMEFYNIVTTSLLDSWNLQSKDINIASKDVLVVFENTTRKLYGYDVKRRTWNGMQAIEDRILGTYASAAHLDGILYVFLPSYSVFKIDLRDAESNWQRMASKYLGTGPVAILNGLMYTIDYGNFSRSCECYDPSADKWTQLPEKPSNVATEALVAAEGQIFCIGGSYIRHRSHVTENHSTDAVEKYNPATASWSTDSKLNKARQAAAATYLNGIYVIGGSSSGSVNNDVEFRCPVAKTWTTLTETIVHSRRLFNAVNIDGKIYIIGGCSSDEIEEYDPEVRQWRIAGTMEGFFIEQLAAVAVVI